MDRFIKNQPLNNPLDIRTCVTQVTQALLETLDLAYRYRHLPLSTVEELQALPTQPLVDRTLRFVTAENACYRFLLYSKLSPAPKKVIQPQDRSQGGSAQNGRWVKLQSTVTLGPNRLKPLHQIQTGYAQVVQRFQGESSEEMEKIFAKRPAFLVEWQSDDLKTKSTVPGSLYDVNLQYTIHAISTNLRPGTEALEGSQVGMETDPGLDRMIGDVRYLLAGCDLGIYPGVKYCDIQGSAKIVEQDLSQRVFVAEIPIVVRASVHRADEDLLPLGELNLQLQMANTHGQDDFDSRNYVQKGYRINWGGGFTETPAPGMAYVDGTLVASSPGPYTFEPNQDTYRDLGQDGVLHYTPVDLDAEPPPKELGILRVGVTRTDGSGITYDAILCSTLEDVGTPNQISLL